MFVCVLRSLVASVSNTLENKRPLNASVYKLKNYHRGQTVSASFRRQRSQKPNCFRKPSHKGASVLPGLVMSETLLGAIAKGLSVFTRGSWSAFW